MFLTFLLSQVAFEVGRAGIMVVVLAAGKMRLREVKQSRGPHSWKETEPGFSSGPSCEQRG
jgi:hypothetical protein